MVLLVLCCYVVDAQTTLQSDLPVEKEIAIMEKLKQLNKPAVKTFQVGLGIFLFFPMFKTGDCPPIEILNLLCSCLN